MRKQKYENAFLIVVYLCKKKLVSKRISRKQASDYFLKVTLDTKLILSA